MNLPSLLLTTAALMHTGQALADSSINSSENSSETVGVPLFSQTINDGSRISEGYANPEEKLSQSANRQSGGAVLTPRSSDDRSILGAASTEIYVSDVTTVLFNDADEDGYYAGFSLNLDVDVGRDSADVYANIYLQSNGARPQLFHTTNVFHVYEQELADRYRVDVELTDNVLAGDYDLIIDVLNAYDAVIEDTVSFRTHSNLSRLPLESNDHQFSQSFNNQNYDPYYDNNVVTTFSLGVSSGSTFNGGFQSSSSVGVGFSASVTDFRGGAGGLLLLVMTAVGAIRVKSFFENPHSSSV